MSPIERAARSLCDSVGGTWETGPSSAESRLVDLELLTKNFAPTTNAHWGYLARAVLQAIREPSEGMLSEGEFAGLSHNPDVNPFADVVWQAMIDAALTE